MKPISRFETVILLLSLGCLLLCGGWLLVRQRAQTPYRITVTGQMPLSAAEEPGERPDSLLPGEVIDLNTADIYDLQRLPGIGRSRAEDIIAYREGHGPFTRAEDILQVSGIGEGTFEKLKDYVAPGATGQED